MLMRFAASSIVQHSGLNVSSLKDSIVPSLSLRTKIRSITKSSLQDLAPPHGMCRRRFWNVTQQQLFLRVSHKSNTNIHCWKYLDTTASSFIYRLLTQTQHRHRHLLSANQDKVSEGMHSYVITSLVNPIALA